MGKSREAADKKRKATGGSIMVGGGRNGDSKFIGQRAWKKKLKRAVKTQNGFKTIMSVLAEEEDKNQAMIQALTATSAPALAVTPAPTPAVSPAPTPTVAPVLASTSVVPRTISFPAT